MGNIFCRFKKPARLGVAGFSPVFDKLSANTKAFGTKRLRIFSLILN
jgi:hypothetical protein